MMIVSNGPSLDQKKEVENSSFFWLSDGRCAIQGFQEEGGGDPLNLICTDLCLSLPPSLSGGRLVVIPLSSCLTDAGVARSRPHPPSSLPSLPFSLPVLGRCQWEEEREERENVCVLLLGLVRGSWLRERERET